MITKIRWKELKVYLNKHTIVPPWSQLLESVLRLTRCNRRRRVNVELIFFFSMPAQQQTRSWFLLWLPPPD